VNSTEEANAVCFSLVRGGPLRRFFCTLGLVRDDGNDVRRQGLALVALTWAPLIVLELIHRFASGKWDPLVFDPAVHARLLAGIPLLVVAEQVMHTLSERCISRFVQSGIATDGVDGIRRAVARGARLRDAPLPEAILAVAAIASGSAAVCGFAIVPGSAPWPAAPVAVSAHLWWVLVSRPVAQFFLYRAIWRWAIWSVVLWGLASLDLRPVAPHPDRRGGLAFLGEPASGFALVVMSFDCFAAGTWGGQMIFERLPLQAYALPLAEIAIASFVVTFGPLLVFSKCLLRARFEALRQYDLFALTYARMFHTKWIDTARARDLLGTSDIQSMADLANTVAIVRSMLPVAFGISEIAALLVAIALPVVPLVVAVTPLHELFRQIATVLFAVVPVPG
jgi:hypothetical protein